MSQIENRSSELDFLNSKKTFTVGTAMRMVSIDSYIRIYRQFIIEGGYGLELGISSGESIKALSSLVEKLDAIDGSKAVIENAKEIPENVELKYGLFEEIADVEKYDYIFASYVMEHVIEPKQIVEICYRALKPGGRMMITVPNAMGLSRQMAVEMGLLSSIYELSENDLNHGHRRVFDPKQLCALAEGTGFKILENGGTFIKQYADFQLNKMFEAEIIGAEQMRGMQLIAKKYPEIASSIYLILEK